ncbi:LysR family transcriptional regulator [Pigmentiphaga aceris]|uniref:LysR family transcriptional regulator n=1 Tax=Pigmentiphaga aceris TaxID=1940612 RepID=A0A5C0AZ44_9BURK|nr:LysR family transcriptional regulator [Pigmentiphaga aceris]QEI07455.1 LysR family transcriptional regulator [Pigmentiphaga aceris]
MSFANTLTPDSVLMVDAIARHGSFAKAARELGKVPSAITYSVRQLEESLDVLLFDRSGHRARLTPAGEALLREGRHLVNAFDALADRVKRVATGWEVELRIAVNALFPMEPLFDLVEDFQRINQHTHLIFSSEILQGNWDALVSGRVDLVIGAHTEGAPGPGFPSRALGAFSMAFCAAPHHPLAQLPQPIEPSEIARHQVVILADTTRRMPGLNRGMHASRNSFTVSSLPHKVTALQRGLGCGFLPLNLAAPHIADGTLVHLRLNRPSAPEPLLYAWRSPADGLALSWFLQRLQSPRLRAALLSQDVALDNPGAAIPINN